MIKSEIQRFLNAIEAMSLRRSFFFVFIVIYLRMFFEGVFEAVHQIGFSSFSYRMLLSFFVHFPMFYLCLFLLLVIVISLLSNQDIRKVTNAASVGLFLVLIVPVIDWLYNRGYMITYPLRLEPYIIGFFNPFVSLAGIGVSPGQRITIILIGLIIGVYGYFTTRKLSRGCLLFLISIMCIIIFGGLTTLLAGNRPENVFVAGGMLYTDTQKFSALYALLFSVLAFFYFYLLNRKYFERIAETIRSERMFFYGAMAVFGFGVSLHQRAVALEINTFNFLGLLTLFASLALGFWSIQCFNDFFDVDIDRMIRKRNPLLAGVSDDYYRFFGVFLILMSLCYALIINFSAFLILGAYLLLGVVYSMPPVRFKKIPLISTFILACAVVLAMALGFSVYYGNLALNAIPARLLIPTMLAVTLGFVAKDMSHVTGDRAYGVITLPVLLYNEKTLQGRLPIALLISISYLFYPLFIPQIMTGSVICAALTLLYTLFSRKPRESFYFVMLYVFGGYLFFILMTLPVP